MYKTRNINILGTGIEVRDMATSQTIEIVEKELNDGDYNLSSIDFRDGDFVVDVGGNIGITAIYLAKKYPGLRVYAYEPLLDNYINLLHNRWRNSVPNLHCIHGAVGLEYGLIDIRVNTGNSGASSTQAGESYVCYSLNEVLKALAQRHKRKCRLLKVDCEGYEVEIFKKSYDTLVEYLSIETHGSMPAAVIYNIQKHEGKLWVKQA